ncbi:MAG: DEAD/DEAH box helicase [Myxococcales bacterium]|nr:DEAD/DEAH box helicase [Myxococcales bacterium]
MAPIKALLNNQEARLERLTGLIGRRAMKWHGDVSITSRKRHIRDPHDVLAITPESLEAMLMSSSVPGQRLLANVRAIVIDEVHAFAAGDRGAHLVALIERIQRLSGHDIQRIGLSATVGDPDAIAAWLSGSSTRQARVIDPGEAGTPPEVHLDYVGSLTNAAKVIDKLHSGTRRLVFVDSRRRVEELGTLLLGRGVDTFLSHSSLAASERHAAERAFEERQNCVIVATSAMELGIDVGDLDHVMQIDAPSTVSSFLQRLGRTGRRPGTRANRTFLTTSDDAVLRAAALLRLWATGYVEPTEPNRRATHVLAHQLIALGIQSLGIGTAEWRGWVEGCSAFDDITEAERQALLDHLLAEDVLTEVDSRFILGDRGQRLYGFANFRELYAVFSAPPVLTVLHGRQQIGTVDAWFAQQETTDKGLSFVLGGRAWKVTGIDFCRGRCHVKPADVGTPQVAWPPGATGPGAVPRDARRPARRRGGRDLVTPDGRGGGRAAGQPRGPRGRRRPAGRRGRPGALVDLRWRPREQPAGASAHGRAGRPRLVEQPLRHNLGRRGAIRRRHPPGGRGPRAQAHLGEGPRTGPGERARAGLEVPALPPARPRAGPARPTPDGRRRCPVGGRG